MEAGTVDGRLSMQDPLWQIFQKPLRCELAASWIGRHSTMASRAFSTEVSFPLSPEWLKLSETPVPFHPVSRPV